MNHKAAESKVDYRALIAASITVVLWASAFVSIRASAKYFGPGDLALGRLLTASAVLGVVLIVKRVPVPPRQAWPGILASGLLWFGLYMVVLNWGEKLVDAGTAAMVVNIGPIVIALLSGWLLKEGFPRMLLAGMAVSFVGAVVVGLSTSSGGSSSVGGVLLCLTAALAYGAGVVLQKPALSYASPIQVTAYSCFVGAAATLPFAWQLLDQLGDAPARATLNVVYLGLFPTALAFSTWAYALSRTTAGKLGATTYAVPAIVVLIAWLVLGEVPGWLTLLGGAICLAGVAVSRRRPAAAGVATATAATATEPTAPPLSPEDDRRGVPAND
ncbi:DMT family transporter [Streptomyces sp. NPDC048664]|uniref:DMT family transporter n=1 Tax=Streptomyces sp. NPDC048664 TaxID=3154505 RepID=UPI00344AF9F1